MAERKKSPARQLSCLSCRTRFKEKGQRAPRLLPCTHKLCERCIQLYLQRLGEVECTNCRIRHQVRPEGSNLPLVRTAGSGNVKKIYDFDICWYHGKELDLFCQEDDCQRPICRSCLTRNHLQHKVVEIEAQMKELLLKRIAEVEKHIKIKISILLSAKDYRKYEAEAVDRKVSALKNDVGKTMKDYVENSEQFLNEEKAAIEKDTSFIEEHLALLQGITESVDARAENSCQHLTEKLETARKLREAVKEKQLGTRKSWKPFGPTIYRHQIFIPCKEIWWSKRKKELKVNMPEEIEELKQGAMMEMNKITSATDIRCKGRILRRYINL